MIAKPRPNSYRQHAGRMRGPNLFNAPPVPWWHLRRLSRWRKALNNVMDLEFVFQREEDVWDEAWRRAVKRMRE